MQTIKVNTSLGKEEDIVNAVKMLIVSFEMGGGETLHEKRNVIRRIPMSFLGKKKEMVVKRFKCPNVIQKIGYATGISSPKAVRAYNNATILRERGFKTPTEIACLVLKSFGLVNDTYYICENTNAHPIIEVFEREKGFHPDAATAFGQFVAKMHEKGVMHHDLNNTNVLYERTNKGWRFSLIDINRMTFTPDGSPFTDKKVCFDNLTRYTGNLELTRHVYLAYLEARGWDTNLIEEAMKVKVEHDSSYANRKKWLNKLHLR